MKPIIGAKPDPTDITDRKLSAFFDRLQNLFADMDHQYGIAAEHYGFRCQGCKDNCCRTRFYHHTYLEYHYIRRGFLQLESQIRNTIRANAEAIRRQTEIADNAGLPVRSMCPLNTAGRCAVYPYRPMICRLHGIPHELKKPGRPVYRGPGCRAFDQRCCAKSYFKFDRTPFYFGMAGLENEFKRAAGLSGRIRMTIADMIIE